MVPLVLAVKKKKNEKLKLSSLKNIHGYGSKSSLLYRFFSR